MKIKVWILVAVAALLVAIQEVRIQGLKKQIASGSDSSPTESVKTPAPPPSVVTFAPAPEATSPPEDEGPLTLSPPPDDADEPSNSDDSNKSDFNTTIRKMSENEVGRSMMAQGLKAMASMWYADLMDKFDLTKEERDYFLDLKAEASAQQQQIGMGFLNATDEEKTDLFAEIRQSKQDHENAVKAFLDDDDDYETYQAYEERLPEHQEMGTLRSAIATTASPLRPEQEEALIEAIYHARTSEQSIDWNGAEGLEALGDDDAVEQFEKYWDAQNDAVTQEVSKVLDETQLQAFRSYREQMREMQLMGLRMSKQMMNRDGD